MSAQTSEEVPFLRDMEREPKAQPAWHEVTITIDHIARKLFTADGMVWQLLKKLRMANVRGPDPDCAVESDLERGIRIGSQISSTRNFGGVTNNGSSKRGWLMDAVIVVILALSAWTLKATIENSRDIAVIQCQLAPTCAMAVLRGKP